MTQGNNKTANKKNHLSQLEAHESTSMTQGNKPAIKNDCEECLRLVNDKSKVRQKIETGYHLAVTFSVLVALTAFLYQFNRDRQATTDATLFRWQQEGVYFIIKDYESIGFDQIKTEYLKRAQQEKAIPLSKGDLQDATLKSILYDLTLRRMIELRPDTTYTVYFGVSDIQQRLREDHNTWAASQWLNEAITNFLVTESGKYSVDEVFKIISEKNKEINDRMYYMCISTLISQNIIYTAKDLKLWINLKKDKTPRS